jgi:hypothetical protein
MAYNAREYATFRLGRIVKILNRRNVAKRRILAVRRCGATRSERQEDNSEALARVSQNSLEL